MSDLLQKLKALSERGVGGEKDNAKRILNSILKKTRMTIEDIEENKEERQIYAFKYRNNNEAKVLLMLYFYLRDTVKASIYSVRNKRKVYGFELTSLENEVLKTYQPIFYKALMNEVECTITAFVVRQDLYAKDAGTKDKLSDEDRAALIRSRDIGKVEINKQLSTMQLPEKAGQ